MIIGITKAIAILWRASPVLFRASLRKRKLNVEREERIFKVIPRERMFKGQE